MSTKGRTHRKDNLEVRKLVSDTWIRGISGHNFLGLLEYTVDITARREIQVLWYSAM